MPFFIYFCVSNNTFEGLPVWLFYWNGQILISLFSSLALHWRTIGLRRFSMRKSSFLFEQLHHQIVLIHLLVQHCKWYKPAPQSHQTTLLAPELSPTSYPHHAINHPTPLYYVQWSRKAWWACHVLAHGGGIHKQKAIQSVVWAFSPNCMTQL